MTHRDRGLILRVRPLLSLVIFLALAAHCGLASLQAQGQCDLQANDVKPLIQVLKNKDCRRRTRIE